MSSGGRSGSKSTGATLIRFHHVTTGLCLVVARWELDVGE